MEFFTDCLRFNLSKFYCIILMVWQGYMGLLQVSVISLHSPGMKYILYDPSHNYMGLLRELFTYYMKLTLNYLLKKHHY